MSGHLTWKHRVVKAERVPTRHLRDGTPLRPYNYPNKLRWPGSRRPRFFVVGCGFSTVVNDCSAVART